MTFKRYGCRLSLVLVLVFYGSAVWACPVCFSAKNEDNRIAFIVTTAFLTFLPLSLIGGGVWWLRRRAQQESEASQPRRLHAPKKSAPPRGAAGAVLSSFEDIPPAG